MSEYITEIVYENQNKPLPRERRVTDKALFDEMTDPQLLAVDYFEKWHRYKDEQIPCGGMKFSDAPRGSGDITWPEKYVQATRQFKINLRESGKEKLFYCVTDLFFKGLGYREIEKGRQLRNGTAKQRILQCLDLFYEFISGRRG